MKLWCLFIVLLIITISTTFVYSMDSFDLRQIEYDLQLASTVTKPSGRSRTKRSQRNANILYRYCRQSGEGPHFCLKYAIRMILATGH